MFATPPLPASRVVSSVVVVLIILIVYGWRVQMDWSELVGKTISHVDTEFGVNVVRVFCDDNTAFVIDTDTVGIGGLRLYRPVLCPVDDYRQVEKVALNGRE